MGRSAGRLQRDSRGRVVAAEGATRPVRLSWNQLGFGTVNLGVRQAQLLPAPRYFFQAMVTGGFSNNPSWSALCSYAVFFQGIAAKRRYELHGGPGLPLRCCIHPRADPPSTLATAEQRLCHWPSRSFHVSSTPAIPPVLPRFRNVPHSVGGL